VCNRLRMNSIYAHAPVFVYIYIILDIGSLGLDIRPEAKYRFHVSTMHFFYILRKNFLNKSCVFLCPELNGANVCANRFVITDCRKGRHKAHTEFRDDR
jgi:hypothetical protein